MSVLNRNPVIYVQPMTKKPSAKESRQKTEFPDCVIASRHPGGRHFWAMPESAASRWLTAVSALVIIVGCEGICDQVKCFVGRQRSRIAERSLNHS